MASKWRVSSQHIWGGIRVAVHYVSPADRQRAQDRVEVFARSMFMLQGLPMPGGDTMGNIVSQALGSIGADELRHPESLSQATIGRIGQLVSNSVESGTPKNVHSAEAARAMQAAGPAGLAGVLAGSRFASLGGYVGGGGGGGDSEGGGERASNSETSSSRRFNAIRAQDDRAREVASLPGGALGSPASTFVNQYGVDRGTANMFQSYGMTGGVYGGLLNQGYGAGQIKQATQFAGDLNVNAGRFAGDLIKVKAEDRGKVKSFVDELRDNPNLTPEQKKAKIQEFRKANPGIAKALDEKALTSIIESENRKDRLKKGDPAARAKSDDSLKPDSSRVKGDLRKAVDQKTQVAGARTDESKAANFAGMFDTGEPAPKPATAPATPAKPETKIAEAPKAALGKPAAKPPGPSA